MIGQADDSEDDVVLAGEYALGLLEGAARADFEVRLANEAALATLLRDWSAQFAALADDIATVTPPPRLKPRIEHDLFGAPERSRRWRWGGGLLAALAVGIAAIVFVPDLFAPPAPPITTEIAAEDRSLVITVSYVADTGALTIDRVAGDVAEGRAQELWLIAEGAPSPVSLGLLADAGLTRLTVPENLRANFQGATLAISDEPPGGSPTGAPTGAVLAAGVLPEA
jgi:anti-sigma-K factor RskA